MKPDYGYWTKLDQWDLGAAILLLLELEPRENDAQTIIKIAEAHRLNSKDKYFESRFSKEPLKANVDKAIDYMTFAWASYSTRKLTLFGISDFRVDPWVKPEAWLEWARTKGLEIPPGLVGADAQVAGWNGFDPSDETYPRELDIAFQAWRYATNNQKSGKSPKHVIMEFMKQFYPKDLSGDAMERIATVCNWDKKGGAPTKK